MNICQKKTTLSRIERRCKEMKIRERKTLFSISSKELTEAHRNLLGLGLKFVPTNQNIDMTELIADVKEWERRMRLREFFLIRMRKKMF